MKDRPGLIVVATVCALSFLLGVALGVVGADRITPLLLTLTDRISTNARVVLSRGQPTETPQPIVPTPTPTSTPNPTVAALVPYHQERTPIARSEADEQRWRTAAIRCRSMPPITGKDAFRLLNMARRLAEADNEADRCWSLVMALPTGESYIEEAPRALMSGDISWSEVYRHRFDERERLRQQLHDQTDALVRELCRKLYHESDCVSSTDEETGEQHLCPLSLGNPSATGLP